MQVCDRMQVCEPGCATSAPLKSTSTSKGRCQKPGCQRVSRRPQQAGRPPSRGALESLARAGQRRCDVEQAIQRRPGAGRRLLPLVLAPPSPVAALMGTVAVAPPPLALGALAGRLAAAAGAAAKRGRERLCRRNSPRLPGRRALPLTPRLPDSPGAMRLGLAAAAAAAAVSVAAAYCHGAVLMHGTASAAQRVRCCPRLCGPAVTPVIMAAAAALPYGNALRVAPRHLPLVGRPSPLPRPADVASQICLQRRRGPAKCARHVGHPVGAARHLAA
jgi:hypothetical protein